MVITHCELVPRMRILHLTNNLEDGAGRAVFRIHKALLYLGVDSTVFVAKSNNHAIQNEPNVLNVSTLNLYRSTKTTANNRYKISKLSKLVVLVVPKLYRFYLRIRWGPKKLFNFQQSNCDLKLILNRVAKVDVVCLYSIQSFLSPRDVYEIAMKSGVPLVWTPLDIEPMTGGCHFSQGCERYQIGCSKCPQLSNRGAKDISWKIFKLKTESYKDLPITFVATTSSVYSWLRSSKLYKGKRIEDNFLLGVDSSVFYRTESTSAREQLNLSEEAIYILFGAFDLDDPRKGGHILVAALQHLWQEYNNSSHKKILDRLCLLTIGNAGQFHNWDLPCNSHSLGLITNDAILALVYNSVDVVAVPSLDDAGPMMVNEAVACGTPIVAFRRGVAIDLVTAPTVGLLVDEIDAKAFGDALLSRLLDNVGNNQVLKKAKHLSVEYQAENYIRLFRNLLEGTSSRRY